jgi:hypothetical protein
MIDSGNAALDTGLHEERKRLVELSEEFEPILSDQNATPDQIQETIEELRAIRMRIHEIDQRLAIMKATDSR